MANDHFTPVAGEYATRRPFRACVGNRHRRRQLAGATKEQKVQSVKDFTVHHGFFALLDGLADAQERADAFTLHMNAAFCLNEPEQAGYTASSKQKRQKADYLRMLRGWSFDADGREGAALKGWVESRFGLLPRHHAGAIRDFSGVVYRRYLEMRATVLYGTNALESQFDLLYSHCLSPYGENEVEQREEKY